MVDFRTVVLDDRAEFANAERFETADEVRVLRDFDHSFEALDINRDSYLIIVTRGHNHDKTVLTQALRTTAGYIGIDDRVDPAQSISGGADYFVQTKARFPATTWEEDE